MAPEAQSPAETLSSLAPARTLDEVWSVFDPTLAVNPNSHLYVPRTDPQLQKLRFDLLHAPEYLHGFLCGHRGSGKTTELRRLCQDPEIQQR